MPVPRKSRRSKTIYGHGTLKLLAKMVKVILDDGDVYEFSYDDVPDYLEPKGKANGQEHNFAIAETGDRLLSVRPYQGSYFVKFLRFSAAPDNPPTPRQKDSRMAQGPNGAFNIPAHLEFTALCQVTSGKHEGQVIPVSMWYTFEQWDDTDITYVPESRRKSDVMVNEFLRLTGMDDENDTIPFSDNVLPDLEELLLAHKQKPFVVSLVKGWPRELMDAPE